MHDILGYLVLSGVIVLCTLAPVVTHRVGVKIAIHVEGGYE